MAMSDLNRLREDPDLVRKHGDTPVSVLRKVDGTSVALDFSQEARLADILGALDDVSLGQLAKDHAVDTVRGGSPDRR